ncbi:hypothetical protein SUGI_0959930 [Cryptomeria japonica]|uniref:uncharacterized protein LOC131030146 n=1 Tax=Cryptomeria japonica TaxID=3369 RepID=UPI002414CF61|nr:uncharacterized protein LOC131030146 [Cryptomeria japonica]GLJ45600.1 hypothetical protein SUGI_0959930 [Cryptomeria japonica]
MVLLVDFMRDWDSDSFMEALMLKNAAAATAKSILTIEGEGGGKQEDHHNHNPSSVYMVEGRSGLGLSCSRTSQICEDWESGVSGVECDIEMVGLKNDSNVLDFDDDGDCDGGNGGMWESLIEQDLVAQACRYCLGLCLFGLLAMITVQYLFLGALEKEKEDTGLCVDRAGVNWVVWVAGFGGVGVVAGGVFWRNRRTCFSCHDMELSRSRADDADKRAQKAQRSKQEFMAYVFHNIRVPFNAIVLGLGYLSATEDGESSSVDVKEKMDLVKLMLDCAETMTNVLNDVADLGQDEGRAMELHLEEFYLLTVLEFLVWGLKDLISHKKICFKMDIEPMVKSLLTTYCVVGDKNRVVQTLGFFLSNAVKFTPAGGRLELKVRCEEVVEGASINLWQQTCLQSVASSLRVQHSAMPPQDDVGVKYKVANVLLSVKDFVTGMSSQDQSKLFEPHSLATSCVTNCGLSGSGFSMAKRFAEQVGGFIGLKSINSKDKSFCLSIPYILVPVDRHARPDTEAKDAHKSDATGCRPVRIIQDGLNNSSQTESRTQRSKNIKLKNSLSTQDCGSQRRVLLVEDTEINRIILRKVLQNLNLQCEEAENGKIAVDYFKQGRTYDLILMDKEMPVMDGHEATRQLRTMGVKTPIIALTGNALQSDKDLFFEAGVDDFQTKPLSRDKLVQLLARFGVESSCTENRRR